MNFPPVYPEFKTERLFIRKLSIADAPGILKIRSNDLVNKHLPRKKMESVDAAEKFIEKITAGIIKQENYYWAITIAESDELIGTACLWNFDEKEMKGEIGYELLPEFQGRGIMNETITEVIRFATEKIGLKKLIALTSAENKASLSLLERKGFKRDKEGEKKIEVKDWSCVLYVRYY